MFMVLAFMAVALVSCSQDTDLENGKSEKTELTSTNFTVLEEREITGEELLKGALADMQMLEGSEAYENLKAAFEKADGELASTSANTRALVPALYKTVRVEYMTTDQDMAPVKASALIVYPLLKKLKQVMLINHGTQIGFMMVPTSYTSVEGIMAATGALCIMPDYIGLGSSKDHPDLYLNHEVHGRTSVDALLALLDYAKAKRLPLDSNYQTSIFGYSQGGSVSLASLREIQRRDVATQQRIHLEQVFCGDGPYDLRRTFETYVEDFKQGKKMGLGAVIPLVINSMFNSFPEEVAHMNYEDWFTTKALRTGVPQAIRANREGILDMVVKLNGWNLNEILNMTYTEEHPENLELILELMDRQNLCKGWQPAYNLKLLHCNPDGVVPFSNFEEAVELLSNEHVKTEVVNINAKLLSEPLLQHIYGMLVMLTEVLGDKI